MEQHPSFTLQEMGHPRLTFTASEVAALMERIRSGEIIHGLDCRAASRQLLDAANQMLEARSFKCKYYNDFVVEYPVPPTQPAPRENPPGFNVGRYPYWTAMGGQIRSRLETLSLAYAISGQASFADAVKKDLLALADWEVWSDPTYDCGGQTCLDTGYIVEGVSTAYDILYSVMTSTEQAMVRNALCEKGLKPLFADTDKRIDHNIHMVRTAALGYGALAMLGEQPGVEPFISRAYDNFLWYLNQRVESGQTEGLLYTSVSMDHISGFAEALARATGDRSLFAHSFVREILPRWVLYFQGPCSSGLVNFSDCSLANYFFRSMAAIGRFNKNPQANWYVASPKVGSAQAKLLHADLDGSVAAPDGWPTSAVFTDIGWAALRSGWGQDDALLAFVSSGSRLGHTHFDQNHFVVNVAGEWLLTDPGYQDYQPGPKHDVTLGTLGHNCILINGKGQSVRGGGRIYHSFISPRFDYIAGDATKAYADNLDRWTRQILYVKPGYFVLLDEIALQQETDDLELLLHPGGSVQMGDSEVGAGFQGQAAPLVIAQEHAQLGLQFVWPKRTEMTIQMVEGAELYGNYIRLRPEKTGKQAAVVTLLQPAVGRASGLHSTLVSASEAHLCYTVEKETQQDYIWLSLQGNEDRMTNQVRQIGAQGVATDGVHVVVSCLKAGVINGYAIISGSTLAWQDQPLISSSCVLNGSVWYADGCWTLDTTASKAGTAQFWLPRSNGSFTMQAVELTEGENHLKIPA